MYAIYNVQMLLQQLFLGVIKNIDFCTRNNQKSRITLFAVKMNQDS